MSLPEALLKVLNNQEEPLSKRLKLADNAFNAPEFHLYHKEALLLKWIVNNLTRLSNEEVWSLINKWLSSKEFSDLTQNEIGNDDISAIIEVFQNKLMGKGILRLEKIQIVQTVLLLCGNKIFQQYFRYKPQLYCKLVSLSLDRIDCSEMYTDFIAKPFLFPKNVVLEENFSKQFFDIVYPVLVRKVLEFDNNTEVFDESVRIAQKCIIQGNIRQFQSFFDQVFNPEKEEKETITMPKYAFKKLASDIQLESPSMAISVKLFFSAFTGSFKDAQWSFKFVVFLTELLQFDVSKDFNIKVPFKHKSNIKLNQSVNAILTLLDVISTKNFADCTLSNITFTEFLRNILCSLIYLDLQSYTVFEIIHKCISINPLVIEPIISSLVAFVMTGNHESIKDVCYEKLVVAIFEVFAKLHRIENFVSKMIPAIKDALTVGRTHENNDNIYSFKGEQDIQIVPEKQLFATDIFTENILKCFTKCLIGLASWQVINVFKTMLYHLKNAVDEYGSENSNNNGFTFLEILVTLTTCLLQSVKIADHTIPQNVVLKFVKGLEELKDILKKFGPAILKREHNHITMRSFLNLSYVWAEVYITLTYYSMKHEVQITRVVDSSYSAANLTYLHSYMDIKEWHLIAQRITNFGEDPCRKLLQKMYVQKLRAMLLLEKKINEDIITKLLKSLQTHLEDNWQDLLLDKFTVNFVLPRMDKKSLIFLAEHLIEADDLYEKSHIKDSVALTNAVVYVLLSKINKLFKMKRKHDGEYNSSFSSKVFTLCPEQIFFSSENFDTTEVIEHIMNLYENSKSSASSSTKIKEDKLRNFVGILKKVPFIYSDIKIQQFIILYMQSLYRDSLGFSEDMRQELENLIIGILQAYKYPLTDIFKTDILGAQILSDFQRHDVLFSLLVDNVFKHEKSILQLEPLVLYLVKNLEDSKCLNCSILILQAVTKVRKSKMDSATKEKANQYKEKILSKMSKLVCQSNCLIEAYATCLKHYLAAEKSSETLKKLLDKLGSYIEYSLANVSSNNKKGCASLFTIVLQNKTKIEAVENDIVLKVWNACKTVHIGDEYSHLIKLIVTLIPNEEFELLVTDLFNTTEKSIKEQYYSQIVAQLKTWKSILTCDVNPTKMKILQDVLEKLIYELMCVLKNSCYDEELQRNIVGLEQSIIQAQHFILSSPLIDMFILTVSVLMRHEDEHFESIFVLSISIMEMLLKHRNAIVMDRLPAFLQQYRALLKSVASKSNSDESDVQKLDVKKASDCVHSLEKLTKNLVACKKDMSRIAVFLIADILQTYEQINLYPNVKLHLNNCVYSLISLCDHHAVSYLLRVLSSASTEMFKIMYEHYKKYYMFTGKV